MIKEKTLKTLRYGLAICAAVFTIGGAGVLVGDRIEYTNRSKKYEAEYAPYTATIADDINTLRDFEQSVRGDLYEIKKTVEDENLKRLIDEERSKIGDIDYCIKNYATSNGASDNVMESYDRYKAVCEIDAKYGGYTSYDGDEHGLYCLADGVRANAIKVGVCSLYGGLVLETANLFVDMDRNNFAVREMYHDIKKSAAARKAKREEQKSKSQPAPEKA